MAEFYLQYLLHRCRQQAFPTAKWELQIALFGLFSILVKTGKQRNMQTFGQRITVSEVYKRSKFWKNHLKRSSLYLIREIRFVSKRTGIRRWKLANCKMGGSCPLMPCCAQIWTQTSIVGCCHLKSKNLCCFWRSDFCKLHAHSDSNIDEALSPNLDTSKASSKS